MAGHSHWAGIKHKKGANDAVRGKIFQKMFKEIYVALQLDLAEQILVQIQP